MSRRERRERTHAKLREPEFLDDLCEEIAEGKTLAELLREMDLKYKIVFEWITGDEERRQKYETAIRARGSNLQDVVLTQIRKAATADLMDALDPDGTVKEPDKIPPDIRPAISGYEVTVDARDGSRTTRIKLADKTRNAELLGKTQAMFTEKVDLAGKMTLEQLVMSSMKQE